MDETTGQVGKAHSSEIPAALYATIRAAFGQLGEMLQHVAHMVDCEEHSIMTGRNVAADAAYVLTEFTVAFTRLSHGGTGADALKALEDFRDETVAQHHEDN